MKIRKSIFGTKRENVKDIKEKSWLLLRQDHITIKLHTNFSNFQKNTQFKNRI